MRNAGRNEKSRRISSSLSLSLSPFLPMSAWEFRRRQVEGIIKVAFGVPFLWEICGRSTCQNGRIVWDTRERRDFALAFNNAGVMGIRSRGGTTTPLKYSDYATRGTRYLRSEVSYRERDRLDDCRS